MMDTSYTKNQLDFLADRRALIDEVKAQGDLPRAVQLINSGNGSFTGCLLSLKRHHSTLAGYAWFAESDLAEFKLQCYIVTKLIYIRSQENELPEFFGISDIFYALFSDHDASVAWMSNGSPQSQFEQGRVVNPAKLEYLEYQVILAIRGDWENVAQRAERFLNNVPPRQKKYVPDMRFFLALAHGDRQKMLEALDEIVNPKVLKARKEDFWRHFEAQFISPLAAMYAKIAVRHGHDIVIDTPFIPKEWLPQESLAEYSDPYAFMRAYAVGKDPLG